MERVHASQESPGLTELDLEEFERAHTDADVSGWVARRAGSTPQYAQACSLWLEGERVYGMFYLGVLVMAGPSVDSHIPDLVQADPALQRALLSALRTELSQAGLDLEAMAFDTVGRFLPFSVGEPLGLEPHRHRALLRKLDQGLHDAPSGGAHRWDWGGSQDVQPGMLPPIALRVLPIRISVPRGQHDAGLTRLLELDRRVNAEFLSPVFDHQAVMDGLVRCCGGREVAGMGIGLIMAGRWLELYRRAIRMSVMVIEHWVGQHTYAPMGCAYGATIGLRTLSAEAPRPELMRVCLCPQDPGPGQMPYGFFIPLPQALQRHRQRMTELFGEVEEVLLEGEVHHVEAQTEYMTPLLDTDSQEICEVLCETWPDRHAQLH